MQCPSMAEIVIVWNNDQTPEKAGFVVKPTWKRPVYFLKTPHNSMDYRYMIPKESKAQVFFSMDDDIKISCEALQQSFNEWRSYAVGDIGPLLSYNYRSFDHNSRKNSFAYTFLRDKSRFYSIVLTGFSWISRFYMDLYYVEDNPMMTQLRTIVQKKNNCDDILLNYVVSYFFPELLPRKIKDYKLDMDLLPKSQSTSKNHYQNRTRCLQEFSTIIGYNPLKIIHNVTVSKAHKEMSTLYKYLVYMRKLQIQSVLMQKQPSYIQTEMQRQKLQDQQRINQEIAAQLKLQQLQQNLSSLQRENNETLIENQKLKQQLERLTKKGCVEELGEMEEKVLEEKMGLKKMLATAFIVCNVLVFATAILAWKVYTTRKGARGYMEKFSDSENTDRISQSFG